MAPARTSPNARRLKKPLMKSEQRYRDLFNHANEGLLIMTPEGQLSDLNQTFAEMHGYIVDELKNSNIRKLNVLGDKTLENNADHIVRILAGEVVRFDVEHYHKDGHIFPLSVTSSFVRIGEQKFLLAFHQDITERKKAEQLLNESEEKFRSITEQTSDLISITDVRGTITYVSPASKTLFQFDPEEMCGRNFIEFLDEAEIPKALEAFSNVIKGGLGVHNFEFSMKRKDGSIFIGELKASKFQQGLMNGTLEVIHDITERKKAEQDIKLKNEELLLLNASKDKFFSIIAHDLKSPLSGLLGLSQLMVENINHFSNEELNDFSKRLYETSDNLYTMIENLLEWARIQKGLITCSFESFNLNTLVKENVEIMAERANQKQITIENNLPVSLNVIADINMTYTILRNLISNAVKFTHRGGNVEIGSSSHKSSDGCVEIFVKDSGVGISETNIDKIFKIDGKIQTSGTENEPSTGLGLILCKEFIEMQGGKIRVESEVGKGSTFYFTLPL